MAFRYAELSSSCYYPLLSVEMREIIFKMTSLIAPFSMPVMTSLISVAHLSSSFFFHIVFVNDVIPYVHSTIESYLALPEHFFIRTIQQIILTVS